MSASVGSRLAEVNFCPILVSRQGAYTYDFPGGWAQPTAPTIYTSVDEFCEFLRTLAAFDGDHAVRRAWIECLRGAAHSWFYHTLPMGTRKYLADAHISEVTDTLMKEFKSDQYYPSDGFVYDRRALMANESESGYETCPQGTTPFEMVDSSSTTPHSSHITLTVRPASNQFGPLVDGRDADRHIMDPRCASWSPQRGRHSGTHIPRSLCQSPPGDDGTPLLSPEPSFCEQFEMVDSEYPTHADSVKQEEGNSNRRANGRSNRHANGHANGHVKGKGLAGARAFRACDGRTKLDRDFEMTDAPRTPRKAQGRFRKSNSPETGRSGISKPKSPPKKMTVRNASASELASIIVDGSARRTRSSSA